MAGSAPLDVLIIEDSPADVELLVAELRRAGFDPRWRHVDREVDFRAHLNPGIDVILSDYAVPGFDVLNAVRLLRQQALDIPFIVVSGVIGEERAVDLLKEGVADYLLKDRLTRLGESIRRAIASRDLQREYARAQQALQESERRYRLMFRDNPNPMWVFDRETFAFLAVNAAATRHYGYTEQEFLNLTLSDIRCGPASEIRKALDTPQSDFGFVGTFKHRKRDGTPIDVEATAHDMEFGNRSARVVMVRDVTDRLRAEAALRENQARTKFAMRAAGIGIWDWDAASGVTTWSETLEQIHGLAPSTFGRTSDAFMESIHPEDRDQVRDITERALAARSEVRLEYRTRWPDGSIRWVDSKGYYSHNADGSVESGVGIGIDVTERHELEAQLVQAQKMDAIGQLAGGVAHDFNNLLTAILGYVELLMPVLKGKERHLKDLEQIQKSALRAARLTGQLLAFSRRQILKPVVIDLNDLVHDVSMLLRRLIGEDIRLNLALHPKVGPIRADPGQIEQVVMNLAVNARDAMESGGTLTLSTANIEVDDQFFRRHGIARESDESRYVVLSVTDTGCGMNAATRKRIFEPFFTTKPKGKGTGLGLATVYGIVKQSGGSVWVYSESGAGTTFKIYLPRTDQPLTVETIAKPKDSSLDGRETILLAEDEEAVRLLSRALLERRGYRVIEASDAEHAFELAAAEPAPIHLLVSDVVMPGQSGPQLFDRLKTMRPDLKVLFLSGYTDEAIVRRGVLTPGTPFLQKPFTALSLSVKVREILDVRS